MDEYSARLEGRELGGYRLLHQLGAGGGGVVYLAQRLDQPAALFALKLLDPNAFPDPRLRATLRARFTREAEAVQRLHHPHILPILAFGEQDGYLYMALPFMPGGDLSTRIGAFPRGMPLDEVATALTQLAAALDAAHQRQIIHRDIKPTNILRDAQGQLYLADFGIARLLTSESDTPGSTPLTLTATGQTLGTPQYMAPEQAQGQRVGPAADIYALGVVLYQMVAGAPPFVAETPFAVAMKQAQEPPPPLRPQRADLPPAAEAAILRALAKRPEARFATAGALAQAFSAGLRAPQDAGATTPATLATFAPTPTIMTPPQQPNYENVTLPAQTLQRSDATGNGYTVARSHRGYALPVMLVLLVVAVAAAFLFGQRSIIGFIQPSAFLPGRTYSYNTVIGHSNTTSLTNSDVNVTLVTLTRDTSQGTVVVISFFDYDSSKGAHFLFQKLSNVYMIDNHGERYSGISASPDQVIMGPGQGGSTAVKFPVTSENSTYLDLYFNTDYGALATPCVRITPNAATAGCP